MEWKSIFILLSTLTNRILITEFKPKTRGRRSKVPHHISEHGVNNLAGEVYEIDAFIKALQNHFASVARLGNRSAYDSSVNRTLILCRK